ncbi:MAG TPA: hypothetical protein PKW80_13510 [Bacteroidales bacterium]|nr:hypothetical protein [Bacteroidales bacterium]
MYENLFKVTMECNEHINDLSGVSFYFTTKRFTDLSISINDKSLPLIKPGDYANLPFTEWFDTENMLFDQSVIYGNKEFWMDIFAVNNLPYFIVDNYDSQKISSGSGNTIEMIFEFTTLDPNFSFDSKDVLINCVPIVNVEKQSVTLSHEDPIRKIATEKNIVRIKNGGELKQESTEQKQFLNLLSPSPPDYERNDFTLRRFGMERFNKNELLLQINSVLNKFSSDYYAFMTNNELKDGEKIKNIYLALKEVADELKKQENSGYGMYLILNQSDTLSEFNKTINVSYLLTDGALANGINPNSVVQTDIQFDVKATRLLMETAGGNDMEMNNEIKNRIAQYYFLTKDRLVTKADIRSFCYKELAVSFSISKEIIEKIDIRNEFEFSSQEKLRYVLIEIRLNKAQGNVNRDVFSRIENQLKKMIEIRSANLFPFQVRVI